MKLSLRKFEIVVVFIVASLCAYYAASYLFSVTLGDSSIYLIAQPQVTNEKEALLKTLHAQDAAEIPDEKKAEILKGLSASSSAASKQVSNEDKLRILQQLSVKQH